MIKNGKLIVLEGADFSGKSTQMRELGREYGDTLILTREPGGTPYAEAIRELALNHELAKQAGGRTQFLLMWASRAEHMHNKIRPAIQDGKIVVSDRFDSSTFAYNIFGQQEEDLEDFFWTTREAILQEWKPDLYIYLDLSPEESRRRMEGAPADRLNHFDKRSTEFHELVRQGYKEFFSRVGGLILDANRPIADIAADIKKAIESV